MVRDSDFELLLASLQQAARIKHGEMELVREVEVHPEDVKPIQRKHAKPQNPH